MYFSRLSYFGHFTRGIECKTACGRTEYKITWQAEITKIMIRGLRQSGQVEMILNIHSIGLVVLHWQ